AVRPYRAWGWTDYASLHTLFIRENHMAANRRNARSAPVEANPPLDTPTFVAAMNSMATAMRDSTAAMRESAAATHRAMQQ
ncbi:hypothetical protein PIB30_104489, partial [Stylosanthes scabra]|nr:hypothetical protein [Stylosanthes scabra]